MRVVLDHEEAKVAEVDSNHGAINGADAGMVQPLRLMTTGLLLTKD
jgi:hypothetical protein